MSFFFFPLFHGLFFPVLILMLSAQTVHAQTPSPSDFPEGESKPHQSSSSPPTLSSQPSTESAQLRPFRNYVGVGGSIGVSGRKTGLSEGGAAIITRNDLTDWLSLRGVSIFGSHQTDNTLALTVNLPLRSKSGQIWLIPFAGGGVLLSSKYNFDDFIVRGLVTGGIDVPLSRRFTATTSVNVGFTNRTNVGVQLGVAYNF